MNYKVWNEHSVSWGKETIPYLRTERREKGRGKKSVKCFLLFFPAVLLWKIFHSFPWAVIHQFHILKHNLEHFSLYKKRNVTTHEMMCAFRVLEPQPCRILKQLVVSQVLWFHFLFFKIRKFENMVSSVPIMLKLNYYHSIGSWEAAHFSLTYSKCVSGNC